MSKQMRFGARVTSLEGLTAACDRLRSEGLAIRGPHYVKDRAPVASGSMHTKLTGYEVNLPGWTKPVVFLTDRSGELTGEIQADNWSENFDNREIDPATGERIPGSGPVSPLVEQGKKEVGEDGRWGDHRLLQRLCITARGEAAVLEAQRMGGQTLSWDYNEQSRTLVLELALPE